MNVFEVHHNVIEDYRRYIRSFVRIADPQIERAVDAELDKGKLWPEPLLQFNPAFGDAGKVADLARSGVVHPDVADVFKGYSLYQHQLDAIRLGAAGRDFVVTSGTGSGKSLTYIGTVFSHLLHQPTAPGVVAVVVYPLNALINSQTEEFRKYQENFTGATGRDFPISYGQYTGQEDESKRQAMRAQPPQILLTNYMMLELLLTRTQERSIRDAIYANLRYLIFDELHTYRGRQGADVAMLIRRIRAQCEQNVTCIGTSATMVSGGSVDDQRRTVAQVASTLFGKPFQPEQVVHETLARSLDHTGGPPTPQALADAVRAGIAADADAAALRTHPLALWLESEAALEDAGSVLVRRKPRSVAALAERLAELTGLAAADCRAALEAVLIWISRINGHIRRAGGRNTLLPFRLHQFISQTGSVYTTLDQDDARFITLEPGIYKPDEVDQKPIYPNVFSRTSGHAFLCVRRVGDRLIPREFDADRQDDDESDDDERSGSIDGYLILGDVWDPERDLEALPDSWFRTTRAGRRPLPKRAPFLPQRIWFDASGHCSDAPDRQHAGWFMKAPLLFDPTSGTFFEAQTREGTKLAKLGSEGRSTSTTITAVAILDRLREAKYAPADQKLLSFTDNRQDAALQAGHFNDFVQVVRLRAAIVKALRSAPAGELGYTELGAAIASALALPFPEYARPDSVSDLPHVRRKYEDALRDFLLYRALDDLRRSWRIVLPNLEQCALLAIDYLDLDDTAAADDFWRDVPIVAALPAAERRDFLRIVLDYFRHEGALHSTTYFNPEPLRQNTTRFRDNLRSPWTLDENEILPEPPVVRCESLARSRFSSASVGPQSAFGKFVKQFVRERGLDPAAAQGERYSEFVRALLHHLADADFLHRSSERSGAGKDVDVFRLKIDRVRWRRGDGRTVRPDVVKSRSFRAVTPRPNEFFADIYSRGLGDHKRLLAADHTGQLGRADRQDREDRFRCDWRTIDGLPDEEKIRSHSISALFCSPTMELGVDIGGLSVVHMRNAPPNAANYAQRSGRAGRSGQGALVFTYCSTYSPHDRHFFAQQAELVAGAVQPPRIDLCNRELLLSHLNALAVSDIGMPGIDAHTGGAPSLKALVDEHTPRMPLSAAARAGLTLAPARLDSVRATFLRTIQDFAPTLEDRGADWFSTDWIERSLCGLASQLDDSLNRWRKLHDAARAALAAASQRIQSGALVVGSEEYRRADRAQKQAARQLNLLMNETGGRSADLSEFYPYRYLAAEGFLPGYNFTRLPIRVFVPTDSSGGEFISRSREIALREFGPLNLIYHNGRKYRVDQMVVQDAEQALVEARVSRKAGYFLRGEQKDCEICPFSGADLSDNANREILHDLLEISESRATVVERISCEEEERAARGFALDTYFSVDGSLDRVQRATVKSDGVTLLTLRYIPAARLVTVNRRWRTNRTEGFPIDQTSGVWRASMPKTEEQASPHRLVRLWTSDTADALYIEPVAPLGLNADGVVSLQHALKRAIEIEFQVEPGEIGVTAIGDQAAPNILLYENAEGSLGILSQFVTDPRTLDVIVHRALQVCRFDDPQYLAPASYDDLMSYYNQSDHHRLDRFAIRDALKMLAACSVEAQATSAFADYDEQYRALLAALDPNSPLERDFIEHLYAHGLRLPDAAQKTVDDIYVRPDFYYEPRVWVFVDGSVHDDPAVRADDVRKRSAVRDRGDEVIVYRYDQDLATLIARRPDVFRKVR